MNEVFRQEKKFLISLEQLYRYRGLLVQVMLSDEHNQGDGYPIRSLYFDRSEERRVGKEC